MKTIINADDFANSLNMSEIICKCFNDGSLNSTSIMINSKYLDESLMKLKKIKNIRTSLHLNIAEGNPVSKPSDIIYLLDKNNQFCKSFEAVFFEYYFGGSNKKRMIKKQIKEEFKNQILLYVQKLKTEQINIDSHQHYHAIPFITDILIELSHEMNISFSYIRVPKEPFFIDISSFANIKNYFGLNIIKHLLLNFFSIWLIKKLEKEGIGHNNAFIGILFTGNVTFNSIKQAMKKINGDKTIEILLHPGFLSSKESFKCNDNKFKRFYTSIGRKNEMQVLLSQSFKNYIAKRENAKIN